ncbi:pilus (MSHA type) biogenesis protein MshL [Burkholderia seminalis]|uniref:pilus (MSHA type) biogenesis protein MshL n=1 Tax=Burkholderia seminalis TaxID=488731 RepID=UPI001CF59A81|nr:pilus (MSHA type) biogenesis protein MshL [Burkholderia seminalis]MCA7955586.1 pilus (MSHA type) biogenesis protein MshL [Burkholderia seminalis]
MQKAEQTIVEGSRDALNRIDSLEQQVVRSAPIPSEPVSASATKPQPGLDKLVDINMSNAPITDLLSVLADQLHMNLMIDPRVVKLPQRATLNMRHVSAQQVLLRIFELFDIDGEIKDKLITVSLTAHQTFNIGMLASKSQLSIDDGGDVFGGAGKQSGSTALKGNTLISQEIGGKTDPYEDLMKSVQSIVSAGSAGGKSDEDNVFTFDRTSGTLYVNTRPSRLKALAEFLQHLQAVRGRQIQIEAQLIDVELTDDFNLGVDWNLLTHNLVGRLGSGATSIAQATSPLGAGGLASRAVTIPAETLGSASGYGNGLAYNGNVFSATIQALRTFGTVRMLSNPVVRLSNGVPAYLSVGTNYRYISKVNNTLNNIGGGSSSTSTDVETDALFSGVVVGVSAIVTDSGKVELFVHPMQTAVNQSSLALVPVGSTGSAVTLPKVDVKGITTTLKLNSGDTVIIGGLINQVATTSNNGLPGAADIPVIGSLFDQNSKAHSNQELIIVLRARAL